MRFVDPSTLDSPWGERPGDDLDGLLTAYFHNELPRPWPAARVVEEAKVLRRHTTSPRRPVWGSRLALAASVALLLAAGWMLSGSFLALDRESPAGPLSPLKADKDQDKPFKIKKSLQQLPSGDVGIRIDVLPGEGEDDEIEKRIGDDFHLPRD